jgi:hypothetical protein
MDTDGYSTLARRCLRHACSVFLHISSEYVLEGVLLSQYLSLVIIAFVVGFVVVVVGGGGGGVVLLPEPSSACTCELRSMLQSIEG